MQNWKNQYFEGLGSELYPGIVTEGVRSVTWKSSLVFREFQSGVQSEHG